MKNTTLFMTMALAVLLSACSSVSGAGSPKQPDEAKARELRIDQKTGATTIKQVIENAARMSGQQVELTGAFRGWKGCPASAMITRSDWVIEDASGCIYVSGAMPEGVSPENAKGENVLIKGSVVLDARGKPAIRGENILRLPH